MCRRWDVSDFKITKAEVDWRERFANAPDLKVWIEDLPPIGEITESLRFYTRKGLYYAEYGGLVFYWSWRGPRNTGGCYGAEIEITLADDRKVLLRGPWSSRAGAINAAGFPQTVDVILNENTFAAVRLDVALDVVKKFLPDVCIVAEQEGGDLFYRLVLKEGRPKPSCEVDLELVERIQQQSKMRYVQRMVGSRCSGCHTYVPLQTFLTYELVPEQGRWCPTCWKRLKVETREAQRSRPNFQLQIRSGMYAEVGDPE